MDMDNRRDPMPSGRLIAACALQFVASGPQFSAPVLYGSIASSFGEEQAHVTALMPTAFAAGTFAMAVPGSLFMERYGLHRSFVLGCAGVCLCTLAQVFSNGLMSLTLLHGAIGVCKAFSGDVAFVAFCASWFHERTSTAIAVCFAAVGAGAALWTLAAAKIALECGWRAALAVSAAVQCSVSLPLAICCMRDPPPGKLARQPSRVARDSSHELETSSERWWLTDLSVWLLLLLNFTCVLTIYGVNNQLTLFVADEAHVPLSVASLFTGLVFLFNMLSKLASGPLYDGVHGCRYSVTAVALLMSGSLLLLHLSWAPSAGAETFFFAVVFGVGYGGSYSLIQSKAALHFGHRRGFKAIQGFLSAGQYAGMTCGYLFPPLIAHAYSYSASFSTLLFSAVAAFIAILAFEWREFSLSSASPLKVPFLTTPTRH